MPNKKKSAATGPQIVVQKRGLKTKAAPNLPPALHTEMQGVVNQENAPPPGRPVRHNRGSGGQIAQLQKTSDIVGEQLLNKVSGQKRARNLLEGPTGVPDNAMAPPNVLKRQRNAQPSTMRLPETPDNPLQSAPQPVLQAAVNGSQFGLPAQYQQPLRQCTVPPSHAATLLTRQSGQPTVQQPIIVQPTPVSQSMMTPTRVPQQNHSNLHLQPPLVAHNERSHASDDDLEDIYGDEARDLDTADHEAGPQDDSVHNGNDSDDESGQALDLNSNFDEDPYDPRFFPGGELDQSRVDIPVPQDPAIDEISDDEDERNALRFLQASGNVPVQLDQSNNQQDNNEQDDNRQDDGEQHDNRQDDGSYNVLQDYHRRNRPNRPPRLASLKAAATTQSPYNEEVSDVSDADVSSQRHAPQKAKKADPETLAYYPETWKIVLIRAKRKYRLHVFLQQAFPKRGQDLVVAREILLETVAECQEEGFILDNGKSPYEICRHMDVLVFKEGATSRGRLKTFVHQEVLHAYAKQLAPDSIKISSQRDETNLRRRYIAEILKGSKFLRGAKDVNGKTDNFGHPCIKRCIAFLYTGDDALARYFPDDFKNSIPVHALALILTCIRNCLEQYASGNSRPTQISFNGERYAPVFASMLRLIDGLKVDRYHYEKFRTSCREWARSGMDLLNDDEAVFDDDMELILD